MKNEQVHHPRRAARQQTIAKLTEKVEVLYNRHRRQAQLNDRLPAALTQLSPVSGVCSEMPEEAALVAVVRGGVANPEEAVLLDDVQRHRVFVYEHAVRGADTDDLKPGQAALLVTVDAFRQLHVGTRIDTRDVAVVHGYHLDVVEVVERPELLLEVADARQ